MKLTLLEYVQSILSSLSSDEVNSISDTTESLQIAEIVKTTFFNIVARANLPEQKSFYNLDASLSVFQPNLMYIPEGVKEIEWLKYFDASSTSDAYAYVTILPVRQFNDYVNSFNRAESNVAVMNLTINSETFSFNYKIDHQPLYCTVLNDYFVIFDAYDASVDSTLQSSKSQCYGLSAPTWSMTDSFIPLLDDGQVPLLLNEAKSLAFFELKQQPHQKAEQEAKRQWSSLQRDKSVDNKPSYFDQLPNFGRPPTYNRGPVIKWH